VLIYERLLARTWITECVRSAIHDIDKLFDEKGYAKPHPELVAAYIQAEAIQDHPEGLPKKSALVSTP